MCMVKNAVTFVRHLWPIKKRICVGQHSLALFGLKLETAENVKERNITDSSNLRPVVDFPSEKKVFMISFPALGKFMVTIC